MAISDVLSTDQSQVPSYVRAQRIFLAVGIGVAPFTLTLYQIFSPLLRGNGQAMIAANLAANPTTNQLHLVFGVTTGFLLVIGFLGMSLLAMKGAPWLATLGGMLGVLGWIPWSPLMGLEALTYDMAQMGGGDQFAALWDRFNVDGVMNFFLLFYIVCHLISAVLLGLALNQARVVPAWSGWALLLSSPVTIAAFVSHSMVLIYGAHACLYLGSIPAALAMLKWSWLPGARAAA
jgi:hypothetical protein